MGCAVKAGPTRCNACGIYVTSYGMERPVDEYGNLDKAAAKRVVSPRSPALSPLQSCPKPTCSLPFAYPRIMHKSRLGSSGSAFEIRGDGCAVIYTDIWERHAT